MKIIIYLITSIMSAALFTQNNNFKGEWTSGSHYKISDSKITEYDDVNLDEKLVPNYDFGKRTNVLIVIQDTSNFLAHIKAYTQNSNGSKCVDIDDVKDNSINIFESNNTFYFNWHENAGLSKWTTREKIDDWNSGTDGWYGPNGNPIGTGRITIIRLHGAVDNKQEDRVDYWKSVTGSNIGQSSLYQDHALWTIFANGCSTLKKDEDGNIEYDKFVKRIFTTVTRDIPYCQNMIHKALVTQYLDFFDFNN